MASCESPRVTIGLPVYNGVKFLAGALDSWIDQDFGEFELIVSDNASTDETPEILAGYQEKDSRIRILRRETTVPAADNFNGLVEEAGAPYFTWSAHDDFREPSFLRKLVAVLDEDPDTILAYSQVNHLYDDSPDGKSSVKSRTYYRKDPPGHEPTGLGRAIGMIRRSHSYGLVFGLFRLDALKKTHLLLTPMGLVSDVGLMLEVATHGRCTCVPEILMHIRRHGGCLSVKKDDPLYSSGRGRRIDDDALRLIHSFPLKPAARELLLKELVIWCRKGQKPRRSWMKFKAFRQAYVHGGRWWIDLLRILKGV